MGYVAQAHLFWGIPLPDYVKSDTVENLPSKTGVSLVVHGDDLNLVRYLAVTASLQTADVNDTAANAINARPGIEWRMQIHTACQALGIPPDPNAPRWWLGVSHL